MITGGPFQPLRVYESVTMNDFSTQTDTGLNFHTIMCRMCRKIQVSITAYYYLSSVITVK